MTFEKTIEILSEFTRTTEDNHPVFYLTTLEYTKSLHVHDGKFVISFNSSDYTPGTNYQDDTLLFSKSFSEFEDALSELETITLK
jgi:hypothetical protein